MVRRSPILRYLTPEDSIVPVQSGSRQVSTSKRFFVFGFSGLIELERCRSLLDLAGSRVPTHDGRRCPEQSTSTGRQGVRDVCPVLPDVS